MNLRMGFWLIGSETDSAAAGTVNFESSEAFGYFRLFDVLLTGSGGQNQSNRYGSHSQKQ
jgi:hypothetical protein